eukprot:Opistho-2@70936
MYPQPRRPFEFHPLAPAPAPGAIMNPQGGQGAEMHGAMPQHYGPPPSQQGHPAAANVAYGPPPPQQAAPQQANMAAAASYQRLKVEDALSYLDQVKLQFGDQPTVYNQFLDIMKEFKSQSIDTPGVIGRVSALFEGHPDLIRGFNTFLPPGYKIEVGIHGTVVQQPSGQSQQILSAAQQAQQAALMASGGGQAPPLGPPQGAQPQHHHHLMSGPMAAPASGVPVAAGAPGAAGGSPPPSSRRPVEFHHAINYVNKIKTRFANQPEIYKQFLEILHTYQKEQRTAKEVHAIKEVYGQVASLFRTHPDLLDEFSQFLPDAVPQGVGAPGAGGKSQPGFVSQGGLFGPSALDLGEYRKGHGAPSVPPSQPIGAAPLAPGAGQQKGSRGYKRNALAAGLPAVAGAPAAAGGAAAPPAKKAKRAAEGGAGSAVTMVNTAAAQRSLAHAEEYAFFDKVKKAINNRQVYDNFLRCLNLYSQEVINKQDLVHLVQGFLGKHADLYDRFKNFVGYKEPAPVSAAATPTGGLHDGLTRSPGFMPSEGPMNVDYSTCKRLGYSYRALPKNLQNQKCTGRTQLCQQVLNDQWVSFPTWSEDTTFLASRKNVYEEAMYKVEDERFELDRVLELVLATIRVFEPIAKRITTMSGDEASKFRLTSTLGGKSEFVHRKAIELMYGARAQEVVEALMRSPAAAIPVVLRRLKQKDDEWRKAQREWNRLWRDVHEQNALKALDYQGIQFKANDKKFMGTKGLIAEVETMLQEEKEKAEEKVDSGSGKKADVNGVASEIAPPKSGKSHFTFKYGPANIFSIIADMVFFRINATGPITARERERVDRLFNNFIPDFFSAGAAAKPKEKIQAEEDAPDGNNNNNNNNPNDAVVSPPNNDEQQKAVATEQAAPA